jgi:hypothetical protein
MNVTKQVNSLWAEFRKAINSSYAVGNRTQDDDLVCLRDYAENVSWSDDLSALLGRETANERKHRQSGNGLAPHGFSAGTASMLILMRAAADGAFMTEMPRATTFLVLRQTAAEAQLIGFLCRHALSAEWCKAVRALDYAKLMAA